MLAAANGYEIPEDDEDTYEDRGDSDLPEELLEAERELQAKKKLLKSQSTSFGTTESGLGLGYEAVQDFTQSLDQNVI